MTSAREEMLARIRVALTDRPTPAPVARDYRGPTGARGGADLLELLAERLVDYRALVRRVPDADDVAAEIERALTARDARRIAVAPGFPEDWRPTAAVLDEPELGIDVLDRLDGVLTTCAVAAAETGSIVLDHRLPGQGRRALTLVPDYHLVIVRADQVVADVPDAVAALEPLHPLTWISGPSATSDIELDRVEGVHGPRTLEVLIVG